MGRLVTGVREAEERLAAVARALQSVYDEEVREATQARDAAARGLVRAGAMEEAARALGNPEVAQRLTEVIEQLRAAHTSALARLQELGGIEKSINLRLSDGDAPPELPRLPATASAPLVQPPPIAPVVASTAPSSPPTQPPTQPPAPRADAAPPKDDPLAANVRALIARIEDVEKLVPKWPRDLATVTVQEHVALVRIALARVAAAGRSGDDLQASITRLHDLADAQRLGAIAGFTVDPTVDWAKVAAETRARRLALADARKRMLSRSG